MKAFEYTGQITLEGKTFARAKMDFSSAKCDTAKTVQTTKKYFEEHNYLLCPHSAVGVSALHQLDIASPDSVALATAHEGKFPAACQMAVPNLPNPPKQLSKLMTMPTRSQTCKNDVGAVQEFVEDKIKERQRNSVQMSKRRIVVGAIVGGLSLFAATYFMAMYRNKVKK